MRILLLLIVALYALGCFGIITQLIVPAYAGRPLFPLFRRRGLNLESDLAVAMDGHDLAALERRVEAAKRGETKHD